MPPPLIFTGPEIVFTPKTDLLYMFGHNFLKRTPPTPNTFSPWPVARFRVPSFTPYFTCVGPFPNLGRGFTRSRAVLL